MVSINTAPSYSLLPPRPIWVLKFPAICLPPEVFLGTGAARRRRKEPPSAVCANLDCCSSGTWVLKRRHYSYQGSRSIECKVWESEGDLELESEILGFMKESEKPEAFPTKQELVDAGRTDLVQAIKKKGGWLSLGWDSDDEHEVQSSQIIEITDKEVPKRDQEDEGHSQERVEMDYSMEIGEVSSDSATTSDASSLEMEDTQETGIEGILSGLEKERNLSFGNDLKNDSYSARAENAEDADSDYIGRSNTVTLASHDENSSNNSDTDISQSRPVPDVNDTSVFLENETFHEWIYRRAGYSFDDFEPGVITYHRENMHEQDSQISDQSAITESSAAVITYNSEKMHEKDSQISDQSAITESSGEVLDKQKDISIEEIRHQLQDLDLQLASALSLVRSKSEKYAANEEHATPDELRNLSDDLEFEENGIMHAKGKLRSLRAKLTVLQGKMALDTIDARKDIREKQRQLKIERKAIDVLRNTCIFWKHPASEVLVTGSFDGWTTQRKMERLSDGVFSLCLMLYPGRYEIKFIVDGEWRNDPLGRVVKNGGHHNNVHIVT